MTGALYIRFVSGSQLHAGSLSDLFHIQESLTLDFCYFVLKLHVYTLSECRLSCDFYF